MRKDLIYTSLSIWKILSTSRTGGWVGDPPSLIDTTENSMNLRQPALISIEKQVIDEVKCPLAISQIFNSRITSVHGRKITQCTWVTQFDK